MHVPGDVLGDVVPLYARKQPFVTVYLNTVTGRRGALRDVLAADGEFADDESLDAIEQALESDLGRHARGVVVVAAEGEVVFRRQLAAPPDRDHGHVGVLPHLLPYVTTRLPQLPNLVVALDRGRSRVLRVTPDGLEHLWPADGQITDEASAWRAWSRHASAENPELVVIAAADRQLQRLAMARAGQALPPDVAVRYVDVDMYDSVALAQAATDVLRACRRPQLEAVRAQLQGKHVVAGMRGVIAALRLAQADAVVLGHKATLPGECWVGPRPTEFGLRDGEAAEVGVRQIRRSRLDAALVRATLATGTRVVVLDPDDPPPPGGIAALLRD